MIVAGIVVAVMAKVEDHDAQRSKFSCDSVPDPASTAGFEYYLERLVIAHEQQVQSLRAAAHDHSPDRAWNPGEQQRNPGYIARAGPPPCMRRFTTHPVVSHNVLPLSAEVGDPVLSSDELLVVPAEEEKAETDATPETEVDIEEGSNDHCIDLKELRVTVLGALEEQRSHRISRSRVIGNIHLNQKSQTMIGRFIGGPFEILMSVVIVINAIVLALSFQFSGLELGASIGMVSSADIWQGHTHFFYTIEHPFQVLYMIELLVRIMHYRAGFFYNEVFGHWEKFNLFDVAMVTLGCVDLYILPLLGKGATNMTFLRVFRLIRLSRTFRALRATKQFSKVRVLLSTVASSFLALSWSMLFLFVLMVLAACFLTQQLQGYLILGVLDIGTQQKLWSLYGTSTRAFWTVFEITLGNRGTEPAELLVEVHWFFSVFFVLYVSGVVFAIICIIQAMFLKDTMEVASNDAEIMVQDTIWKRRETCRKLEQIFEVADVSGDGALSPQEFEDILSIPEVSCYMELLEIEVREVRNLFSILDNGTGLIRYEDFVNGIMTLKGQARTMDIVTVKMDLQKVMIEIRELQFMIDPDKPRGRVSAISHGCHNPRVTARGPGRALSGESLA